MSSNKALRISLKIRLAFLYTLLFFISCSMIFVVASLRIYNEINRMRDEELYRIAENVQEIYAGAVTPPAGEYLNIPPEADPEDERHRTTFYSVPDISSSKALKRYFNQLGRTLGQSDFFVVLWDQKNQKSIFKAGAAFKTPQKVIEKAQAPRTGVEIGRFRCIYDDFPGSLYLISGHSIANRDTIIRQCMVIFFGILLVGTGIGIVVAWLIARRFIKGIKQTTLAMQSISGGDYSYRIEIPYNDEEIVTLMENFNTMNERTENLLKEIRMMSDNVAHDLRTPLTRISGTVELLMTRRELAPEVHDVCISVLEETLRLKALVNTIMDISRTNAHPDSLKKEKLDLVMLVGKFCDFMLPAFEERSLSLKVELPDKPLILEADRTMVQRMLANLIENALKFTDSGGVELSLESCSGNAVLKIKDSGCGISADDLPHIFDRFFRADASRHLSGNGLGLALVKAVVDAHKWKLDVNSTPGVGTTFIITIPLNVRGTNK